jgi:hypothetical protein
MTSGIQAGGAENMAQGKRVLDLLEQALSIVDDHKLPCELGAKVSEAVDAAKAFLGILG